MTPSAMRMHTRLFTRLTNASSKEPANSNVTLAFHLARYNLLGT
jgi:hypothetical protein